MAITFGDYLLTRRVSRHTANPALVRRIQAAPGLADVTNLDELVKIVGSLSMPEELGIRAYWRSYLQSHDRQIERRYTNSREFDS